MDKKVSLVSALSVLALVGAGCSTTTDTGMVSNTDVPVVQNENTAENVVTNNEVVETPVVTEAAYNVGDDVMLDLGYGWYEGKVEDFKCDSGYYIRYKSLSANCFTEDKLVKPVTPSAEALVVGAKVIANIGKGEMFAGKEIFPFYNAEITAVNGDTYTVKDSSKKTYDLTIDKIYLK